jgi:transcriptional regulator with XRE-family HTH domain
MSISKEACRAARVGIGWSRAELATAAGLGERTIIDFERGAREPPRQRSKRLLSGQACASLKMRVSASQRPTGLAISET